MTNTARPTDRRAFSESRQWMAHNMQQHRVAYAFSDASTQADLIGRIRSAWPAGSTPSSKPPAWTEFSLPDLSAAAEHPDASVVCIDARAMQSRDVCKAVDLLCAASASGTLIVDDACSEAGSAHAGILVMPESAGPEAVAASLFALCSREEAMSDVRRDLQIAQRTSGGVREEMSRISQELSLASRIQQELIPRQLPDIDGIEFGVLFRPASYVSGDIYNVAQIDDETIAFFIADAVGHGVPAALLTMIISRSLAMKPGETILRPSQALSRLNNDLCDVSDGTPRFATAVYGLLNTVTGHVRIANGGHPQPMRIGSNGVGHVDAGGPLLGVFKEAEYPEEMFELLPGETLLLYSDGFETAFPDADAVLTTDSGSPSQTYIDHLLSVGRRTKKSSASVAGALLLLEEQLDGARGSLHQADDVTALALARHAA